ncbi:MAG: carbon storage regulator CsrA [Ignavibacteriales bacterium]|nr:carbon storage regulator CsrA [Ignavibacteriales bacterium]MBK7980552.1 carbon storage regulator CsrA [Ignavibacteriota bacterium]
MLILTRKENQKIRIGNNIILNIISISDNQVKIGIEAEKDVAIFREEVYQQIIENNKNSTAKLNKEIPENLKSFKINKFKKND